MVLRCTAKALDLLGGRQLSLVDAPPLNDDWYLNLLWFDRRKCLLLTHAGTAFSIFLGDVRKADLAPLSPYVVEAVTTALRPEGLPDDALGALTPDDVRLAKTASRKVLGFMNDIAFHISYAIDRSGGLAVTDSAALHRQLHRMLHNYDGRYADPVELVRERMTRAPR